MKNYLLHIISIVIFIISATLNISGYVHLFPNSVYMASIVLAGLELGKFAIVSVVYNSLIDVSKSIKSVLSIFLVILVFISIIGHYAMFTSFYTNNQSISRISNENISLIDSKIADYKNSIKELRKLYNDYPEGYASKRFKVFNQVLPKITQLEEKIEQLEESKKQYINTKHKNVRINIFQASADLMQISTNQFAFIIILILSFILDPLALMLVYTANKLSIKKNDNQNDDILSKINIPTNDEILEFENKVKEMEKQAKILRQQKQSLIEMKQMTTKKTSDIFNNMIGIMYKDKRWVINKDYLHIFKSDSEIEFQQALVKNYIPKQEIKESMGYLFEEATKQWVKSKQYNADKIIISKAVFDQLVKDGEINIID